MLRDDDETRALVAALLARRGARQIDSLGHDGGHARQPHTPGAYPSVDELHAVTMRSWATFHAGDILTPIPTVPPSRDRCVEHFLALFARETRSAKTGLIMSGRHRLETEP